MAAGRSLRSLVSRRRRAEVEGEDEEGPVVVEDSQSEGSVLSEPDDDDGDGSSLGHPAAAVPGAPNPEDATPAAVAETSKAKKARKARKRPSKNVKDNMADSSQSQENFKPMPDTEAMMNGLKIGGQKGPREEVVDFETMGRVNGADQATKAGANGTDPAPMEQHKREHEEYRKKRDSDPAFIPNRGNFFMHDTRGLQNGQPQLLRGAWQTRGQGRGAGGVGGPFSPANRMAQAERAAEQLWKHDLHDTINEEPPASTQTARASQNFQDSNESTRLFPKPAPLPHHAPSRVLSFSSTTLVGKVQIRVSLYGMKAPIVLSEVPWKHYIRLPDHRPPLRRDKPVRVFLPGHSQRYIFPASERSFIFIPRQNRPNQTGYHRVQSQYQRSIGGYGYSSRRTSMYGGSIYSGSVAPSRRSSLAGGISRENAFSPVGSIAGMMSNRPVVNLPHGPHHFPAVSTPVGPLSGHQTPTGMPQMHSYPPPQPPAHYGTAITTVHHPRPQKANAISIDGIESPMLREEPHAFRNQLPAHMHEQAAPPPQYFSPQHMMGPPQPQTGTPLTGIPEQAIHAPAFQPPGYGHPTMYAPYPPPQNYYYPAPSAHNYHPMPIYMPPQSYIGPQQQPGPMMQQAPSQHQHHNQHQAGPPQPTAPQQAPPNSEEQSQRSQSGMVAHESNGMVFYVPASEAQQSEQYQPAESFVPSYAMPGLPPPTPPESTYYYPSMTPGMQDVATGVYYPTQS